MYIPTHFSEPRLEILHEHMRARPLATLITLSSGGIEANHIPLHLAPQPLPFGTLRGHVARANPVWSDIVENVEALAIFHGPDVYITPAWYPTKAETGKAVPTWNYVVAHAYGTLRVVDDPSWMRLHLESLTARHEAVFPEPWRLSDAPQDFADKLIRAVVGIEIVITRLSGKWKISQNQPARNQAGIIDGLRTGGTPNGLEIAAAIEGAKQGR